MGQQQVHRCTPGCQCEPLYLKCGGVLFVLARLFTSFSLTKSPQFHLLNPHAPLLCLPTLHIPQGTRLQQLMCHTEFSSSWLALSIHFSLAKSPQFHLSNPHVPLLPSVMAPRGCVADRPLSLVLVTWATAGKSAGSRHKSNRSFQD